MNNSKGLGSITIDGTEYPIKFGVNQTEVFCELEGCELGDYNSLFSTYLGADGNPTNKFIEQKVKLSTLKNLLLSAFQEGAEETGQDLKYTAKQVGNLMDLMGAEHWGIIMRLILGKQEPESPNGQGASKAPKSPTMKATK